MKTGSTGALCFVAVEHTIATTRGTAIRERQDIVYRDMSAAQPAATAKPAPPAPTAKHRESHMADAVLLFRYSALTFNGHRIHYDRDYVTKVEGYPGLVFHGPLQAALIVELAAKLHGGAAPKKFTYRGVQPLFEGSEFSVNANENGGGTGTVDREFAGPADDEGHGDVVEPSLRAKRSNPSIREESMDCFVASLLAMTNSRSRPLSRKPAKTAANPSPSRTPPSTCCARSASRKCSAIPARPNCRS